MQVQVEEQTFKSPPSQAQIKVISAMIRVFFFVGCFLVQGVTARTGLYNARKQYEHCVWVLGVNSLKCFFLSKRSHAHKICTRNAGLHTPDFVLKSFV